MKNPLILMLGMVLACAVTSYAQSTQSEAQAAVDSLLPSNTSKTITAARLRQAFTKTLNYAKTIQNTLGGKANLTHGHAPSELTQSGATTGQVIKWNGSTWAPSADVSAGTPTWGGISGTLSNQADLNNRFASKLDTGAFVTPEMFGAVGNGVTNDRVALQNMFNAYKKGKIVFLRGKNYFIGAGTLTIKGSGNEQNALVIEGYGAKITSTNSATTATILFDDCMRTSVKGLEIDGTCDFDGWYFGNMEECYLKRLRFGNQNLDTIDETYWSVWRRCKIANGIYIHTGTAGDRTEFNANSFYDCNIWFDTYAIHLYGNQNAQNCNFYNCDLSYQTVGRMEIEQDVLDSQFNFYSCYWDDDFSIPVNTKNVVVNTYGFGNNPNSGNIGSHATLNTGSQNDVSSSYGGRTGSRVPMSSYNLIINGDLKSGKSNVNADWTSVAPIMGAGLFRNYLRFSDNTATIKSAEWKAIKAPFTGYYAVTVIGRNVGGTNVVFSNVVNNVDVYYNPVSVNDATDFVVSTGKVYLQAGDEYKFRLYTQTSANNVVDIAYVGLTFGRTGGLTAVSHPEAGSIKTTESYYEGATAGTLFTLPIAVNERISAKCTCYGADPTYPDGATFNEAVIVASRSDTQYTYSITPQTTLKTGAISAAPSFSVTESGGVLSVIATPADGNIRLTCELKGTFRQ